MCIKKYYHIDTAHGWGWGGGCRIPEKQPRAEPKYDTLFSANTLNKYSHQLLRCASTYEKSLKSLKAGTFLREEYS